MSTQQTAPTPEAPVIVKAQQSVFDDIVENHEARMAAEQAKSDSIVAKAYQSDANAYIIAMGRDLGLNPATSLQLIHLIGGKPALSAGARALFLRKAGYHWLPVEHTDKVVTLRFWHNGDQMTDVNGKPLDVSVTFEEAERAGWVQNSRGSGKVGNYDKIPRNMLHARVISNFHRWYAPDVIGMQLMDTDEALLARVVETTEQNIAAKSNEKLAALAESMATAEQAVA
mgnify:CR=1 FL=1